MELEQAEFLCVRCARHMKTCCQTCEVYVTLGDVARIAAHTGRENFHEFRPAGDPIYTDHDDDPTWMNHVFRADGTRRVLKREANGDCTFLGPHGCRLPLEVRPLVCRIYPYDYNEQGFKEELTPGCPLELVRSGLTLIDELGMNRADAQRWHRQLYEEIHSEEETAEFDRPDTIDAIETALQQLGHATDRIGHARQLVERLAAGNRWDLVFNICEGLTGPAREAQVPALLDVYGIPCTFSDPLRMALCLHKGLTKVLVRAAGVATPDFAVVERVEDLDELEKQPLPYPLFAKPIAEGTGKGVGPTSILHDAAGLRRACEELLARLHQPVLVEEYLPGREFTVGLLGTGADASVLGTLEIVLGEGAEPNVYSYVNKEHCEELVVCPLVRAQDDKQVARAEEIALLAWRALGCRDAGRIDLRCDRHGNPHFLEVNPLAGLHPSHSDLPMLCTALGMPYIELIERIVRSAATRCQPAALSRAAG